MAQKKGSQKPTRSRILSYKYTEGPEAIALYEKTGRKLLRWQKALITDMLGTARRLYVHTRFGYAVPRRNGKNEVIVAREMHAIVNKGEKVLHTAHRTTTSHSASERLSQALDDAGYIEKQDYTYTRQLGLEVITFLSTGGRVAFRTRSAKGGLGEGFDLLIIDEAQEYTEDQQTALKYVVSDSANPQTVMLGTPPTAVSTGTVFPKYRKKCLARENKRAGWAEWSIQSPVDIHDKDFWYLTNPSLGVILTERKIEDEIGSDTTDFCIQRLGLWLEYNQHSAIARGDWTALAVDELPQLTGKMAVGVKYGSDGTHAALSIAIRTSDDRVFIEAVDCRPVRAGNAWILGFIKEAKAVGAVIVDGAGGEMLRREMRDMKLDKPILPTVKEIILANFMFEQGIEEMRLCHRNQPSLTETAANCDKRTIGSNGGFGYRSIRDDLDIALLDSAILAFWGLTQIKKRKQTVSY